MINKCQACGELFREGDAVQAKIRSTYHILRSDIVFALDRNDMEYVKGSLKHVECLNVAI